MTFAQGLVFAVLGATLALFLWGRWRYDVVALLALLAVSLTGLVEPGEAFAGFGHPAVITVAAVLVISRGLQNAGVVDALARLLARVGDRPTVQVAAMTAAVAVCSAFMNNVGALALLMPIAIWMARRSGRSAAYLLMPLAFGSLLGGMMTLIGTPPNIIVASFRRQVETPPFGMFDYAYVGLGLMLTGVAFIALVGWRLVPDRKPAGGQDLFDIDDYLTEVLVPEGSPACGQTLHHLETKLAADSDLTVVGLVRGERRRPAPSSYEVIRAGDILIVEADADDLKSLLDAASLTLAESRENGEGDDAPADEIAIQEAIVRADSPLVGRTVVELDLRQRHRVNLLALARQGQPVRKRLSEIRLKIGDILLLQGAADALTEMLGQFGCLPLAERRLQLARPRRIALAGGLFAAGIATVALGWLPAQLAFATVAAALLLTGVVSLRDAYDAVDWPVIVLLGAMIPVGAALESTGGAQLLAELVLRLGSSAPPWATVGIVLVGAMFLSDIINNAAAAVLLCPLALRIAAGMNVSPDPLLMAVAVGASCAFLTPIGHQSNTLVMEPGGYRFGDYWRLGLPLEVLIVAVGLPLILWCWPLTPAS